jgi:DNA-binding transcriptional ArsR family regulator
MAVPPKGPKSRRSTHKPLGTRQLQAVAELFSMLSEESRLHVLQALQRGPLSVGELVETTAMKQANVSKQLRLLQGAGIISRRQDGNRAIYSIAMPMVFELCDLVCRGVAVQAAERAAVLRRPH